MKKYYGPVWNLFEQHKQKFVARTVEDNIRKGIEEGLYRENIKVPIIAQFYVSKMEFIIEGVMLMEVAVQPLTLFKEVMRYHMYAIVSEKGRAYLVDHKLFEDEK